MTSYSQSITGNWFVFHARALISESGIVMRNKKLIFIGMA